MPTKTIKYFFQNFFQSFRYDSNLNLKYILQKYCRHQKKSLLKCSVFTSNFLNIRYTQRLLSYPNSFYKALGPLLSNFLRSYSSMFLVLLLLLKLIFCPPILASQLSIFSPVVSFGNASLYSFPTRLQCSYFI